MFQLADNPGRCTIHNKREYLFFSGYGYLGVQHDIQFKQLVKQGIEKHGWLFPSSRISNTQTAIFDQFEDVLSYLTNTAKTISFSSGFSAGTIASGLFKTHPTSVCPDAHPAINKLQQQHTSFDKWAENTLHHIHEKQFNKTPVLIADSVNPLTGEINDFDFLKFIEHPVIVIIDDSHGIGLLGNKGEGISSILPKKENIEYVLTYSLSKAFSINGGAISCSNINTANLIKSLPEFTASTAIAPALAYAFMNGQAIYKLKREQLLHNISFLSNLLKDADTIFNNQELPVFILPEYLDEDYFSNQQIIISSFAYPNPQGKKINRAVINALHTEKDLSTLAKAILQQ